MVDISTDVMIVGTDPAGSAKAALLSSCGIENWRSAYPPMVRFTLELCRQ
jgi:hypothetical protein